MDEQFSLLELQLLNYNKLGMDLLRENRINEAINYLKQAESSLDAEFLNPKIVAITYNNLGCFYKKVQQPEIALKYLKNASKYEDYNKNPSSLAGTHLNLCVIYSELQNHQLALDEGLKAIKILENQNFEDKNTINTYIIAHYNSASEFESLLRTREAITYYRLAYEISVEKLGPNHQLTNVMRKNFEEAVGRNLETEEMKYRTKSSVTSNGRAKTTHRYLNTSLPPMNSPNAPQVSPNINEYKKKIIIEFPKVSNKFEDFDATERSPVFVKKQPRFLTGDRMQPMFLHNALKNKKFGKNRETSKNQNLKRNIISKFSKTNYEMRKTPNGIKLSKINEDTITPSKITKNHSDKQTQSPEQSPKQHTQVEAALKIQKFFRKTHQKMISDIVLNKKTPEYIRPESINISKKIDSIDLLNRTSTLSKDSAKDINICAVQASFRGYLERQKFLAMKKAAEKIQTRIRVFQCRKLYISIRDAIMFIQKTYRSYSHQKSLKINS